ncbi:MAG TPA: ATP-binding protein [Terriglobia bacterium]|nr:ATP-binding protein [Terriglobia bacterium]
MPNDFIRLKLPAQMESLRPFTAFVHRAAEEAAFPEMDLGRLDLVMEEVVVNVINYAYADGQPGSIEVGYLVEGPGKLSVQVCDGGRAFDPLAKDPPDLRLGLADRPIGGLGIFLVKQIAHNITYTREGERNILTFHIEAGT